MSASWAVDIPATPPGLIQGRDALDRFCDSQALQSTERWPLQVVFDEVVSNIVRHAASSRPVEVRITFVHENDTIRMEVEDDGPPFDPLAYSPPDRSTPLQNRTPGGLGITLVRGLMDRVEYRREGRNILILTRRVAGAARRV